MRCVILLRDMKCKVTVDGKLPGETGKQKRILLAGLTAATLRARLAHL